MGTPVQYGPKTKIRPKLCDTVENLGQLYHGGLNIALIWGQLACLVGVKELVQQRSIEVSYNFSLSNVSSLRFVRFAGHVCFE